MRHGEWAPVLAATALVLAAGGCGLRGTVDSEVGSPHPSVRAIDPPDRYTFVGRDTSINVDVSLPNVGQGVAPGTLVASNIRLVRTSDGMLVDATVNTSGGGDAIVLQPRGVLDARTDYDFYISRGVTDQSGASFVPFQSHFSTGDFTNVRLDPHYRYAIAPSPLYSGVPVSSVAFGPDGRLYATDLGGVVRRWAVNGDGSLGLMEEFRGLAGRTLIGIAFDPVRPNVIWVTTNAPVYVQPAPDFSGTITRLTLDSRRRGFVALAEDVVVGLPRSAKDHMANSLAFGPDGALYVTVGSTTASGAPDPAWYDRSERLLSAAVLRLDLRKLPEGTGPLDVTTEGGPSGRTYDPSDPDAPLTIYGDGLRNAYDLVWHSNGHLYCPTNSTSAGGDTPGSPPGVTPIVPALTNVSTQDDSLFDVSPGGYYGHPDPARGHYVLLGGNPTPGVDAEEVASGADGGFYPVGVKPEPDWRRPVYNFSRNRSPDGAIEVKSGVFGGALRGWLLVAEYSAGDDILAIPIPAHGGVIDRTAVIQVASGLSDPVDLAEDVSTGNLYVAQLVEGGRGGGAIVLLRPDGGTP